MEYIIIIQMKLSVKLIVITVFSLVVRYGVESLLLMISQELKLNLYSTNYQHIVEVNFLPTTSLDLLGLFTIALISVIVYELMPDGKKRTMRHNLADRVQSALKTPSKGNFKNDTEDEYKTKAKRDSRDQSEEEMMNMKEK